MESVPQEDFLFGVSNNIDRLHSNRLRMNGLILTVSGLVSIVAAGVACALQAVKTFQMHNYMNTHWITSVFFFAGLSLLCMERYKLNFLLYLSVGFLLVSVPVAFTSFIFDCININIASNFNASKFPGSMPQGEYKISAMQMYSSIDLVCCFWAFFFSVYSLWKIQGLSCRYFCSVPQYKSKLLVFLGCLQGLIGIVKIATWLSELSWLRAMGEDARFLFLNYTLDEPVWNSIYVIVSVAVIICAIKGTRLLMYVTVVLVPLCAYPCAVYLWIDYRWYMNRRVTEVTMYMPKQLRTLEVNMFLGGLHLFVILGIVVQMIRSMNKDKGYLYRINCNIDQGLRKMLYISAFLLVIAGVAMLIIDIENVIHQSFYRVFHATEQKLPFFLLCAGVLTFYMQSRSYMAHFLPTIFVVMIMCLHISCFPIAAYIYLAYNAYFGERLCDFFYWGNVHCNIELENSAAMSHFFESALSLGVLFLTLFLSFVLARIMSMHQLKITQLDYTEERRKRQMERGVLALGIFMLSLGLAALTTSIVLETQSFRIEHPLLTIHGAIYRTCFSLSLIIYPLIQIVFCCKGLLEQPLLSTTLCLISLLRLTDIIIQLDYRQIGSAFQMSWTLVSVVEITSMLCHFLTIILCAVLLDMGLNRLPQFEFVQYSHGDTVIDEPEDKQHVLHSHNNHNNNEAKAKTTDNNNLHQLPQDPWAV